MANRIVFAVGMLLVAFSCTLPRRTTAVKDGEVGAMISVSSLEDDVKVGADNVDAQVNFDGNRGPVIMNAIRDELTGEMVAVDSIVASRVVSRFRNVAERSGKIVLEFDMIVPRAMLSSGWRLKFFPQMRAMGDTVALEPVFITGEKYRDEQMRGYRRYQAFIDSIIADSSSFIRQGPLEMFVRRYFPDTYLMKTDSSYVSDMVAENIFGVSMKEAVIHYTRHGLWKRNERKKARREEMFARYVRDPLTSGSLRLDTVLISSDGDMVYRYSQNMNYRPGLKKVEVSLDGELYENGRRLCELRKPEDVSFYISSLSTLADLTPRYVLEIVERRVTEDMEVMADFRQGESCIDTSLGRNASELDRLGKWVDRIVTGKEFGIDSVTVTASCSPEGAWSMNDILARSRAEAAKEYVGRMIGDFPDDLIRVGSVPENWERLKTEVMADSLICETSRKRVLEASAMKDADAAERLLASIPEYGHVIRNIYPKLRSVHFKFHLYRMDLVKDTVHTMRLDTLYMRGVEAIGRTDYKTAISVLRPYGDYNTALALYLAGYDDASLDCLGAMDVISPKASYLQAIVLSGAGKSELAKEYYRMAVEADPALAHRANLDPEIYGMTGN